jgi:hypothetical protein
MTPETSFQKQVSVISNCSNEGEDIQTLTRAMTPETSFCNFKLFK